MSAVLPRHVICVLGNWESLDEVDAVIEGVGAEGFHLDREYSQLEPDERMVEAFEASFDRVSPTMTDADWDAIERHNAVAYVLSPPMEKEEAIRTSSQGLLLTAALLHSGGVAAKSESAGLAHGKEAWLKFAQKCFKAARAENLSEMGSALYWAWVRRPLQDDDDESYYTCGMHLLGEPDFEVETSLEVDEAVKWLDLLGLYILFDRPTRPLLDGEGFRLKTNGPRQIIRKKPCERYDDDAFFFNPYGYIRLESPEI